ncbi:hypothetical protein PSPO01_00230 [Paraphaeosphaeria sporulosa]
MLDPITRKTQTILNNYFGQRFNNPDDTVSDSTGNIFFTDPLHESNLNLTQNTPFCASRSIAFVLPQVLWVLLMAISAFQKVLRCHPMCARCLSQTRLSPTSQAWIRMSYRVTRGVRHQENPCTHSKLSTRLLKSTWSTSGRYGILKSLRWAVCTLPVTGIWSEHRDLALMC